MSKELEYVLLVCGLFLVPRALQRFRIPSAVTCVGIGAMFGIGFDRFHHDPTVTLMATLGIVALFLFAGLEVDFTELRLRQRVLIQHVAFQLVSLTVGTMAAQWAFGLDTRPALLCALALLTPSTGFILDSLDGFGLSDEEKLWVKAKAIASELVALTVLFFALQSQDVKTLGVSAVVMAGLIAALPPVFRIFARLIAPFAKKAEFTFLVILALVCAYVTRELGVYYLVGAFVVGVTAVRLRRDLPELSSVKLMAGVELFASFFIPFYFFKAGLHLEAKQFTLKALAIAAVLLGVLLPLRVFRVALHRRIALAEGWRGGLRIGAAVIPTLVFTIVIAEILLERFNISSDLFGALIIFALATTLVPGLILKAPLPEFETPEAPRALLPPDASESTSTASAPNA